MTEVKYIAVILLLALPSFRSAPSEHILPTEFKTIHDVCFSKGGKVLLVADGTNVRWFSTDSFSLLGVSANGHRKQLLTIDLSADSSVLATGGKDSTIVLWNVKENNIQKRLNVHKGIVTSLRLSSDNKFLISGGTDHKAIVYDLSEQKILYTIPDHTDDVTSVAFHPNGQLFCTGGADGTVNFYDMNTGKIVKSFHDLGFIREIDFNHDGSTLIASGDKSKINSWTVGKKNEISQHDNLNIADGWLFTSKFNDDNESIGTGGLLGIVRIRTNHGNYSSKLGVAVSDIEFKPNIKPFLTIAIATLGDGVHILDGKNMKFKN